MSAGNDTAMILQNKTEECGAVLMVPPLDQEDPLSEKELEMQCGTHVVEAGVDFGRYVRIYRQEVHGIPSRAKKKPEEIPSVVELFKAAGKIDMEINLTLLIAHDSKDHRKHGRSKFAQYVQSDLGIKITTSTIHRRIAHGRLALILAAKGLIDKLPSQSQAEIITCLPRSHWPLFFREVEFRGKGEEFLKREVTRLALRNRIPLRGQRVDAVLSDSEPIIISGDAPENGNQPPPAMNPEPQNKTTYLPELNETLRNYLPGYRYQALIKKKGSPARRFVSALKAENRKCREPERVQERLDLLAFIQRADPELARQIMAAAVSRHFQEAERNFR